MTSYATLLSPEGLTLRSRLKISSRPANMGKSSFLLFYFVVFFNFG